MGGNLNEPGERASALLSALYYSNGPAAAAHLVPLAIHEDSTSYGYRRSDEELTEEEQAIQRLRESQRKTRRIREQIAEAIISLGRPALPFVEGSAIDGLDDAARQTATSIAHAIRNGEDGDEPRLIDLDSHRW